MKKSLLVVGLLVAIPALAGGAESSEPLRLTLPQAVALALTDNPDIALSRHRQQSAEISVEASQGQFLPSLQGSTSGNEHYPHQPAPGEPDHYGVANLQLTASLNLFNGFADSAGLDTSKLLLQAADADLMRQRQTVAFTVVTRFITVLSDVELVQVAKQNLQSQQDLETQIDAFYRAGVRSITDLYQQQAATAQARFSLIDAQRNLEVAKLELLQSLGRTEPREVETEVPDTHALNAELNAPDPTRSLEDAFTARPDLLAQQWQIDAARQQIRVARAGYLPTLDLQAAGSSSYNNASNNDNFASQIDDNRGASIGLNLSVPIFDRDQTRTNVAQARISEAAAATTLLKLRQQVALDVGQALADYQRARQQLIAAASQLTYAKQALAASEARYKVGAGTWIELSNTRAVLVQAQGDEVRARYGVLLQGLNIGYARGDLEALLKLLSSPENPT